MIRRISSPLLCFAVLVSPACAQDLTMESGFPAHFKDRVFEHIEHLAALGPRPAGSETELKAIRYVQEWFAQSGLRVQVEPFEFEAFEINHVNLTVCGDRVSPRQIGFNPYLGRTEYSEDALFISPSATQPELNKLSLKGRALVTTEAVDFFALMDRQPALIVYLGDDEYRSLESRSCRSLRMQVTGSLARFSSANVVADLGPSSVSEGQIIISAHLDSYRSSPGADDNGSGIGALLELARYFKTMEGNLKHQLRFIAFGAEELGILGSRMYLGRHRVELGHCILVFNMDQIGGPRGPFVELLGGVQGVPDEKGVDQFPSHVSKRAWEGVISRWRLLDSQVIHPFTVSNRPEWLKRAIEVGVEELGYEIIPRGNMGSDQRAFTQAGIVATSVGSSCNERHSPEDTPDQIVKESIETAGKIVAQVVLLTMKEQPST